MGQNKLGNIYSVHLEDKEKYTAVQVIEELKNDEAVYLALDYYADTAIDKNDLSDLKALWVDHNHWNGKHDFYIAKSDTPLNYSLVDNLAPLEKVTLPPNYDNSWGHIFQIVMQYQWLSYSEDFRKKFKDTKDDTNLVSIQGVDIKHNTSELRVNQTESLQSAEGLDKLPLLSDIAINKSAVWLVPYLNKTPYIYQLLWNNHGLEKIDLSTSGLSTISLTGSNLQELYLGNSTDKLNLTDGIASNIAIHAKKNKLRSLTLHNGMPTESMKGLEVEELILMEMKSIDIDAIHKIFPNVKSLLLQGSPGIVENVANINKFKNLDLISFNNIFGFDGTDFPSAEQMPNIKKVWMTSIPLEVGMEIKNKYPKSSNVDINISVTRSADWIKKNLK